MRRKKFKLKFSLWITVIASVILAYFVWLTWNKLTEWIGDTTIVWIVTGVLVFIFMVFGVYSFRKIAESFT